jgi:hypothetical protein
MEGRFVKEACTVHALRFWERVSHFEVTRAEDASLR